MSAVQTKEWFTVDREGLRMLLGPRGKPGVLIELISNALDENTTKVDVRLTPMPGRPQFRLEVEDDAPEGFKDLTHAYTLFAPSTKKNQPGKRGRFNFGEKLVLAFCRAAKIETTTGMVHFTANGRAVRRGLSNERQRGTLFSAILDFTRDEAEEFRSLMRRLILAGGGDRPAPTVTLNGDVLDLAREPVLTYQDNLETPIADDSGNVSMRWRQTTVQLFRPKLGEMPTIYELGIPVVPHEGGCGLHVNVLQKVPLTMDRDNISVSFRRQLMGTALSKIAEHGMLESEARQPWVSEMMETPFVSNEAVRTIVRERFGEKVVVFDPSDPEANKLAVAKGFTVVSGGSFSAGGWEAIRRSEALMPAGKVTPSPRMHFSSSGVAPIDEEQWSPEILSKVEQARTVGRALLNKSVHVKVYPDIGGCAAAYGAGTGLSLNWSAVRDMDTQAFNALLLHEYAHETQSDHLDVKFADEVARLGAKLAAEARMFRVVA